MTVEPNKDVPVTPCDGVDAMSQEGHECSTQDIVQAADSEEAKGGSEAEGLREKVEAGHGMPEVENQLSPGTVQPLSQLGSEAPNAQNIANPYTPVMASSDRGDSAVRIRKDHLNNLSLLRPHTCPAQGSSTIRGPMRTLHLPFGPSSSGTSPSTWRKKEWPHSSNSKSQSPKRSCSAQHYGIPGYLATPGEQYATPPALILRSHSGTVEGQLQYQFGKVAPLGPAYSSAWVCDPPQRPSVSDFRLQPSQRSHTCYSPEFVLQSVCLGGWASPQRTRPGTAHTPAISSTSPPATSGTRGGATRPHTAPSAHGHLHCNPSRSPPIGSNRPKMDRGNGLAFGRAAGKVPGLLQKEERRGRPWTSQPYCEGIRKGLPPSPATEFIRATAKSSFQANAPNAPRLRQACEEIGLAQSQSRRARFEELSLHPCHL
ncbi:hypothetical protein DUNSADRAFT_5340 [Dunaliella salina]|uniref:Encoded protein n=1 Tax=Dunaliella salina TaxID=3046 RepID=A0ABQ7GQG4_DUNSA|nr:hypothetical protein DUNSADRAFT_5340 [Dunaliella salina]|eukprot:KAF5836849.1 hypothetical protein DUNSADRAFT_5340 [Dunaliella salina]